MLDTVQSVARVTILIPAENLHPEAKQNGLEDNILKKFQFIFFCGPLSIVKAGLKVKALSNRADLCWSTQQIRNPKRNQH